MPQTYIRPNGTTAPASEALDGERRLRAGYKFGTLASGESIGFDVAMFDSAPAGGQMFHDVALTDAETAFRDSAEGRERIAFVKSAYALTRKPWDAAAERQTIHHALIARDAQSGQRAALIASRKRWSDGEPDARRAHELARTTRIG